FLLRIFQWVSFRAEKKIDEGVCVYERPYYEGRFQCWASGTNISDLAPADWRDRIGSISVFGHARTAAYDRTGFRGDRLLIDHDVPDLRGDLKHEMFSVEVQ